MSTQKDHTILYSPMVVVFPPPLTPTIMMTAGRLQQQNEPTKVVGLGKLLQWVLSSMLFS
jgi:hypothetical protein